MNRRGFLAGTHEWDLSEWDLSKLTSIELIKGYT